MSEPYISKGQSQDSNQVKTPGSKLLTIIYTASLLYEYPSGAAGWYKPQTTDTINVYQHLEWRERFQRGNKTDVDQ